MRRGLLGRWLVWLAAVAAGSIPPLAKAQSAALAAESTATDDALHSIADRASTVFFGTVTAIRRLAGDGQSSGAVEITFTVEQAVAGAAAGSTYTLREWGGLWAANDHRYRVGERRLMLLHAPGPGGFSAPVDGPGGSIPIVGTAPAVGPASTTSAPAADAAVADLRWVNATAVTRPLTATVTPAPLNGAHGTPPHVVARLQPAPSATTESGASHSGAGNSAAAAVAASGRPLRALLSQLAQWEVAHAR